MANEKKPTAVVLKNCILSYPNLFKPRASEEGEKAKYSASLIYAKDSPNVALIQAAIDALMPEAIERFGVLQKDGSKKLPSNFKLPVRDGNDKTDEAYQGNFFINCSSGTKPGVVDMARKPIAEDDDNGIYPGCIVAADLNFYIYPKPGKTAKANGIAVGLNNILKIKDGTRLAGKPDAATAFAEIELDESEDISFD